MYCTYLVVPKSAFELLTLSELSLSKSYATTCVSPLCMIILSPYVSLGAIQSKLTYDTSQSYIVQIRIVSKNIYILILRNRVKSSRPPFFEWS